MQLGKGQKIPLNENNLVIKFERPTTALEIDTAAFLTGANGKVAGDEDFVFYGNARHNSGAVILSGDALEIDLAKIPRHVEKISLTATIYDAESRRQNFGMLRGAVLKIFGTRSEIATFPLENFTVENAIVLGEVYRYKGSWKFNATGAGFSGGLAALCNNFGIEVKDTQSAPPPPEPPKTEPPPEPKKKVMEQKAEKISLKKGEKISLTKKSDDTPIIIENGWTAEGKDYDLKALVRYRDGKLIYVGAANEDEVLSTPEGAVQHGGDIKAPGEMEKILIKWHPNIASVAVSSYSALENGLGSFKKYGVFVRITNGKQVIEIPAASTSNNYFSYTLCFGEILFGKDKTMEVSALELYSSFSSERRIGYDGDKVKMDIGPVGKPKSKPDSNDSSGSLWSKIFG